MKIMHLLKEENPEDEKKESFIFKRDFNKKDMIQCFCLNQEKMP